MSSLLPQLPGYETIRELGHGGMGVVLLARQVSLDRLVAVKLLLPGDRHPVDLLRFRREGRYLKELAHPNLVRLLDYDLDAREPFLVFDYIDTARTLGHVIAYDRPDQRLALVLTRAVAEALAHVHERGIVHRDIKPGNVLIDAAGEPRLIDLGLARGLNREESIQLTAAGEALGTMVYMAPEQLGAEPADARSDVYALGLVMYELLAKRFVFACDEPDAVRPGSRLGGRIPPVTRYEPTVREGAVNLLARCLALDPGARPRDARELADALAELLDEGTARKSGRPVDPAPTDSEGPPTRIQAAAAPADAPASARSRLAITLGVGAFAAALVAVVLVALGPSWLLPGGLAVSTGGSPAASAPAETPAHARDRLATALRVAVDRVRGQLDERWLASFAAQRRDKLKRSPTLPGAAARAELTRALADRLSTLGLAAPLAAFAGPARDYFADPAVPLADRLALRGALCDLERIELFCRDQGADWPAADLRRLAPWDEPVQPETVDFSAAASWLWRDSWYEQKFAGPGGFEGSLNVELPKDVATRRVLLWFTVTAWRPGFVIDARCGDWRRLLAPETIASADARKIELSVRFEDDAGTIRHDVHAAVFDDPRWDGARSYLGAWVPGEALEPGAVLRYRVTILPLSSAGYVDGALRERVVSIFGSGTATSP